MQRYHVVVNQLSVFNQNIILFCNLSHFISILLLRKVKIFKNPRKQPPSTVFKTPKPVLLHVVSLSNFNCCNLLLLISRTFKGTSSLTVTDKICMIIIKKIRVR